MTIRLVLADDQSLLRATFRLLLDSTPDIEVVGEAATGREAVELARTQLPDLVVMDIRMPDMDGIDATRRICEDPALSESRILILTTFETDDLVLAALRAGASGFLGKGVEPAGLLAAIRTVAAGEQLLSPSATTLPHRTGALRTHHPSPRSDRSWQPHQPRTGDHPTRRRRTFQQRDRRSAVHQSGHRQDPREPSHDENRCADRAQLVVMAYQAGVASLPS
jgi:DNA-binding NarL/FixJ family response regulator